MNKQLCFNKEIETIQNEDLREFAKYLRDNAVDYFYFIPASSSSNYHPITELGMSGLMRHSMNVVRILNYLLGLEQYKKHLTERECDLMRIAMLFHDSVKNGWNGSAFTLQNHPTLAAQWVKDMNDKYENPLDNEEIDFVYGCIEAHSGQWNTSKKGDPILPKPATLAQELCHLSDYIGSRRDIEIKYEEDDVTEVEFTQDYIDNYVIGFGKYKGNKWGDIKRDKDYVQWLYSTNFDPEAKFRCPEPVATFCQYEIEGYEDDVDDWEI